MASPDKSKIFAAACNVYVARRTDDTVPIAHSTFPGSGVWLLVGYCKGGTIKLTAEKHAIDLHDGQKHMVGVTEKIEFAALETDATKMTELETHINKKCDIILKPVNTAITRVWKLLGFNLEVSMEGPFDSKDAFSVPVSGQAIGTKPSDIVTEITLA